MELLLVALDDQQVVAADGDEVFGVGALGVHRVGGDDRAVQVDALQQRGESGDFIAFHWIWCWAMTVCESWREAARR